MMPIRQLTPLPGTDTLKLLTAGGVPFVLSQLCQVPEPAALFVSSLERGPESKEDIAAALAELRGVGALSISESRRISRVTVTPLGRHLVEAYRGAIAWASSVTIDPFIEGSTPSWWLMDDLCQAWTQGLIVMLAGRGVSTAEIAGAIERDPDQVEALLARLAEDGLVARTGPKASSSWILLKDGKRAIVPIAAAVLADQAFNPAAIEMIKPGHVEVISRLCIESIRSDHFAPQLEGAYAALAAFPDGRLAGSVAEFSGGSLYSVHPYREGAPVDGGFQGSVEACIDLVANGDLKGLRCLCPDHRGGLRMAIAIATGIGHAQRGAFGDHPKRR